MLDELPPEKNDLRYELYMDNLFSNPALYSYLQFRGYSATGTIRENRIPKQCSLTNKKMFVKIDRGFFETAMEKSDGHLYVRWMDNSVVTMMSTSHGAQEIEQLKRYSQQQEKNILVTRPKVIAKYNAHMGGTDQMDQNLGCYRLGIRGSVKS
ncbi:piggyBac transposable element-derived protein 4-like [Anthonomus grandis grandis]|uniref:piggyBac transposable element-derived protein 4-like n=1 Tax=Anthonomus grandis grandis TaxID=2921223 RepID=UPI0021654E0F|nr:piggyBac transposable element-derived protein 4-like [Anthonomus grandis grandis]